MASCALPPLARGPVALRRLRAEYECAVERVLARASGADGTNSGGDGARVALVVSPRLASLLAHVFVDGLAALAKGNAAECVELAGDAAVITSERVVYLTLAGPDAVRDVAVHATMLLEHRRSLQPRTTTHLHLYAAGKWTAMSDQVLEGYGVSEFFQIGALPLGFIPLDSDLLTLGFDRCFYDCHIAGNTSCLVDAALAVNQLQRLYGKFKHIKYKGELSMRILNHLAEMNATGTTAASSSPTAEVSEFGDGSTSVKSSRLDTLIMLDRNVDYASALSTPLTYEALMGELIGIQDGFLPAASINTDNNGASTPIALNSTDVVYNEIRSMTTYTIPPTLNARASAVKESFTSFQRNSSSATAEEIQAFVKEVPNMKVTQRQLEQHIAMLEFIDATTTSKPFHDMWQLERGIMDNADDTLDKIEDMILRHDSLLKVLRVLCLYSIVNGGLPRKDLERLKLHLVRSYGHELVFSFDNLDRLKLLYESPRATAETNNGSKHEEISEFQRVAQLLGLIDLDIDAHQPTSAAFVTGGYLPITCRLVEEVLKNRDWRAINHAMEALPGPRAEVHLAEGSGKKQRKMKRPMVVVLLVGGITYLEVAALRWMASFYPVELIIASTSLENGNVFITKVLEHLPLVTR